ncbi:MAG: CDP-alcohol phosphatidyltransferase family protein [Deltaproteobacteria bacterium]|nr:CDP-alcohol phosphatidyltransferase family protein [Deltaproteobacteria bacterium]
MCPSTTVRPPSGTSGDDECTQTSQSNHGLVEVAVANETPVSSRAHYQILGESDCRIWGLRISDTLQGLLRDAGVEPLDPAEKVQLLLASNSTVIVQPRGATAVQPVAVRCAGCDADRWRDLLLGDAVERTTLPAIGQIIDATSPPPVYDYEMRKKSLPFIRKVTRESCREIEQRTFELAYKGVTDLVTKYVYPWPAFHATRLAVRLGLTPNTITFASLLLVFAVLEMFVRGQLAAGLVLGFAMSFLDTLDGKLARVTQTSSRFGKHFDHLIDLIHPPFWWLAWWWGAAGSQPPAGWNEAAAVCVLGYLAVRVQEWRFKRRLGVRIHVWKRFDSHFRLITTRRNPNLLLLSVALLAGNPQLGLFWLAGWTLLSFAVHAVRWAQAEIEVHRTGRLESWLESA